MNLQESIERVVAQQQGTFGVYVKHLITMESASVNGDRLFQTASVFKVPILATLMRDVVEGRSDLNQRVRLTSEDIVPGSGIFKELEPGVEVTIKDLATMMIIVSDNLATDQVLSIVGKERVQEYMSELGLSKTFIRFNCWELLSLCVGLEPKPYSLAYYEKLNHLLNHDEMDQDSIVYQETSENNVSTPVEMGILLEHIVTKKVISEEASAKIFDIMTKQQLRNRIPRLLPKGTLVGCKSGTLGSVVNDCGIVQLPDKKGLFVIAVFSKDNPTIPQGEEVIAKLALTAYDYFVTSS